MPLNTAASSRMDTRAITNAPLATVSAQLADAVGDMQPVSFRSGAVLRETDDTENVFFLDDGLVGLQVSLGNGRCVEAAALGRDAVVGVESLFRNGARSVCRAIAYTPVAAHALSRDVVVRLVGESAAFRHEIFRALGDTQMAAMRRVACARFHSVGERVARWLLIARSHIGDSIPLPHAVIADALGCRRSGVTVAMLRLRDAGVVSYTRAAIRIVNPAGLAQETCGCAPSAPDASAR